MAEYHGEISDGKDSGSDVILHIYDMSKGMASTLSPFLLGKQIPAIWHTGVVVYDLEYFFGSGGIECIPKGQTILGQPDKIINMGRTEIPYNVFIDYCTSLATTSFKPESYDLFEHNCNNFSQDLCQFLTGKSIPQDILDLPNEVSNTPLGLAIKGFLQGINVKNERNMFTLSNQGMQLGAMNNTSNSVPNAKQKGNNETNNFRNLSISNLFSQIDNQVPLNKTQVLNMIERYLNSEVKALDLKLEHLTLLIKLLENDDEAHIRVTLEILKKATAKEDFIEFLNLDLKNPALMKCLKYLVDTSSIEVHTSILEFLRNVASLRGGLNWLMAKANAWTDKDGKIWTFRMTSISIMVSGLLSISKYMQELSAQLAYHITSNTQNKEDLEDCATEFTTALLHCLQNGSNEATSSFALQAILILIDSCPFEVPGLVKMLAPDLSHLNHSQQHSSFIQQIQEKINFYTN